MPVSSLVVTLSSDPGQRLQALSALSREARVWARPVTEQSVAVVTETESLEEGEALFEQLRETTGITFVDVVAVDFSDLSDLEGNS